MCLKMELQHVINATPVHRSRHTIRANCRVEKTTTSCQPNLSLFTFTPHPTILFFFFCIPLPIVPNCNVMILSLALSSSCAPGCWSEPLLNIHKEGKGGETDEESKESHALS